ncbi:hypothetical protein F5Y18DRAFT_429599 [Xylariaceae sp. FL1019]|nr:hypothetical protein F5Y18DRAFT_429599 [Xylariaceae sp. FL1019]
MAQKTSDSGDQPNPPSSSTKEHTGPASQKQSTSHTSSPAPAPSSAPPSSPPTPPPQITTAKHPNSKQPGENAANAQSMNKSTSAASNALLKDAMAGPSPYGTRSRNRGQTRPNYAEDKDLDVDMEDAFPERREEEPKKGLRQSNATTNGTTDATRATAAIPRKGNVADDSKAATNSQSSSKEPQPAASSSANTNGAPTAPGPSKKRKAPTQSATSNAQSQSSTPIPTTTAAVGTRRGAAQAAARAGAGYRETNMLSFEKYNATPKDGKMIADDGTTLQANDHVYLVCEPPGEPYYLGRIMEFLHVQNDEKKPVDALRINWYYRPKDIGKKINDTRQLFATMHSDISPLTALRGKCQIRHKAEVESMDAYRKTPDCFWYEKLYDRYIQKQYDVIPCFQIINVPDNVKKVLDERWKYILVEQGRAKEFTSAVKLCKRCNAYCASNDSVDCAVCEQTYHMYCVRPPLLKKPSRGFGWACAVCSRARERKLEGRHNAAQLDPPLEAEEEEIWDEEEDAIDTTRTSPADGIDDSHLPATAEQTYQNNLWPYRYLGQHCKPQDALDYDDRIYPRAGSRLGPKHQATVVPWYGRPVKLVKPIETKKGNKKDPKFTKENSAAIEAERLAREKNPWIQTEPPGYCARGEDYDNDDPSNTAQLLWKPYEAADATPPSRENATVASTDARLANYISSAKAKVIPVLGLPKESTNFLDVAINTLFANNFKTDLAFKALDRTEKSAFKEPELSPAEVKKFEEGVTKYGSELHLVTRHVKSVKHGRIVRFYYAWKKSDRGKQIWGNYTGRKGKKEAKKAEANAAKLQDDVADDHDDSAFDTDKALQRTRSFMCKFCGTKHSRQWRRAPNLGTNVISEGGGKGANKEKAVQYISALCRRCAELWRRYGIQWEDIEDLAKKVAVAGARGWKRKVDEELLKELMAANEMMNQTVYHTPPRASPAAQPPVPAPPTQPPNSDPPPRKKLKTIADKEAEREQSGLEPVAATTAAPPKKKEKPVEKPAPLPPPPPAAPELPKLRTLPCFVCDQGSPIGEQTLLCCRECRLTVHRACYGIFDNRHPAKWTCDQCINDKNPQASIEYRCVLCPVEKSEHDFLEPPKNTHKKKTEKDREKERNDRELAVKAVELYRKRQLELNRPISPREPLKRTAANNWVHVTCAVWHNEIKFGNAKALSLSEGIQSIPRAKYDDVCKVCNQQAGACVHCHTCRAPVHVECAHKSGYTLGFEITPVKGSRRDQHNIVTIGGETGSMSAAVWCKEHSPQRTVVHRMSDPVTAQDGVPAEPNALQLFVRNFKQADLALTGTVRKANLANLPGKAAVVPLPTTQNRRHSSATVPNAPTPALKASTINEFQPFGGVMIPQSGERVCITCGADVSPRWYSISESQEKVLPSGHQGTIGDEAQRFIAQRSVQCHKCHRDKREPVPHIIPPPPEVTPLRPPVMITPNPDPGSPHHMQQGVGRISDSAWGPRAPMTQPGPPAGPPTMNGLPSGPPPSLPLTASRPGPSPIAAPGPPPGPSHHYPAPATSYNDWQRTTPTQVPVLTHAMNGNSSGPSTLHHNHLRDLRPPPITAMPPHHPVGPIQHGLGQPVVNGVPSSPPRRGQANMQNGVSSFVSTFNHSAHQPGQALTNGGPPTRTVDHSFSQGLLGARSSFSAPHGSPSVSRDGVMVRSEPNPTTGNPPPRPTDRPTSGASASPSLRNLLS